MTTEEVLAELRRPGWRRVGTRPATKSEQSMDQAGNTRTIQVEVPGQQIWTLVGPNGQPDEITVSETAAPSESGVDDGQYSIVKGPSNTPSADPVKPVEGATRRNVSGGYVVQEIYQGGNWVTNPDVAPQPYDPKLMTQPREGDARDNVQSGYQVKEVYRGGQWVTDPSVAPVAYDPKLQSQPKEGDTRPNVSGGYSLQEVFRGGSWVTDPTVPPKPYDPKLAGQPKEGDARDNVQGGYKIRERFSGGSWVTDPSVAPVPYDPKLSGQPKEGDSRDNVQGGYKVHELYRGGQWITDPSVAPVAYDPKLVGQPKEGDTRSNVQGGYEIQEIYRGGNWVTNPGVAPKAYDPKLANQPKEGDSRDNVQSGYRVKEVYRGGQWVIDPNVPPQRFTPREPANVTAANDQANIVRTDENGNVITQANPNYQPKTSAEIAGRVGVLQQTAAQQQAALRQKAQAGEITWDQANSQFNSWWDQSIGPQMAGLQAASQTAAIEQARNLAATRSTAQNSATAAGTEATNAFSQLRQAKPVGPGYAQAVQQLAARSPYLKGIDVSKAVTWQGPNPVELSQQAMQNSLKYIDQGAAQAAGLPPPNYGAMDIDALLGRDRYAPGAGAPPPPPMPVAAGPVQMPPPPFKTGWPGSDPRLSGILDPTQYQATGYSYGG